MLTALISTESTDPFSTCRLWLTPVACLYDSGTAQWKRQYTARNSLSGVRKISDVKVKPSIKEKIFDSLRWGEACSFLATSSRCFANHFNFSFWLKPPHAAATNIVLLHFLKKYFKHFNSYFNKGLLIAMHCEQCVFGMHFFAQRFTLW